MGIEVSHDVWIRKHAKKRGVDVNELGLEHSGLDSVSLSLDSTHDDEQTHEQFELLKYRSYRSISTII